MASPKAENNVRNELRKFKGKKRTRSEQT